MALVQGYIDGQGSETKKMLDEINQSSPPTVSQPTQSTSTEDSTGTSTGSSAGRQADSSTDKQTVKPISSSADKQANSVTDSLTGSLIDKQASRTADTTADKQADRTTDSSTKRQVSKSADRQVDISDVQQEDRHIVQQADTQIDQHVNNHDTKHLVQQAVQQTVQQPYRHADQQAKANKRIWMPLTKNQGIVLMFLHEQGGGITNTDIISAETRIPYGTIRSTFNVLINEGYITSKEFFSGHAFKGFTYTLDSALCSVYVNRVRQALQQVGQQEDRQTLQQAVHQSYRQIVQQANRQPVQQTDRQAVYTSSSRFLEEDLEPTTTKPALEVLSDPELRFWAAEGVTEKQIQTWMAEFQMSSDEIAMSLRYGRFDILERGDIQNSANWFYKILTRNGFYPKPANYRSLFEIRAEAIEQDLAKEREARERLAAAETERAFQQILAEPESEAYQALLSQTNEFAREMGGQALETVLREIFVNGKMG